MTIGIRVRNESNNTLRLDITDFTVSSAYKGNIYIAGNGALTVSGIDSSNYIAFIQPCFDAGAADGQVTYMPNRVYISGSTVYWETGPAWRPGTYTLQVVRKS